MTKEVVVQLRDDISKELGEDVTTHPFVFDGVAYEIELSEENFEQFKLDMEPYVAAARAVKKSYKKRAAKAVEKPVKKLSEKQRKQPHSKDNPQAKMRAWGRANGYEVAGRGGISAEVKHAYEAAHRRKKGG
jgi:hypothetical protein